MIERPNGFFHDVEREIGAGERTAGAVNVPSEEHLDRIRPAERLTEVAWRYREDRPHPAIRRHLGEVIRIDGPHDPDPTRRSR